MKVGLMGLNLRPLGQPGVIPIFVQAAERLGFESVDVMEHICVPVKQSNTCPIAAPPTDECPAAIATRSPNH